MTLTRLNLERFTAFAKLRLDLSPGINVLVGANGTGKTHLLKVAYAACDITRKRIPFPEKLVRVFLPKDRALGRLVKRQQGVAHAVVEVFRGDLKIRLRFSTRASDAVRVTGDDAWTAALHDAVYIPVKEMLANAPGFRSLYAQREIHFEEVYDDIVQRAFLPTLRGPSDPRRKHLLGILESAIEGRVRAENEEFFLQNDQGNLEFTLLAEGLRKLGLLWLLIQNGTLLTGSVLFWDEPETNLNPKRYQALIEILFELARSGVQIFLATHDYVILKELDLQARSSDQILFHALYRDDGTRELACHSASSYLACHPNVIAETFSGLYDREVKRSLEGSGR